MSNLICHLRLGAAGEGEFGEGDLELSNGLWVGNDYG